MKQNLPVITFCFAISLVLCRLLNDYTTIDSDLPTSRNENLTNILLYGNQIYDDEINQINLMNVIQ